LGFIGSPVQEDCAQAGSFEVHPAGHLGQDIKIGFFIPERITGNAAMQIAQRHSLAFGPGIQHPHHEDHALVAKHHKGHGFEVHIPERRFEVIQIVEGYASFIKVIFVGQSGGQSGWMGLQMHAVEAPVKLVQDDLVQFDQGLFILRLRNYPGAFCIAIGIVASQIGGLSWKGCQPGLAFHVCLGVNRFEGYPLIGFGEHRLVIISAFKAADHRLLPFLQGVGREFRQQVQAVFCLRFHLMDLLYVCLLI